MHKINLDELRRIEIALGGCTRRDNFENYKRQNIDTELLWKMAQNYITLISKLQPLIEARGNATEGEWHKVGLPWNNQSPYIIAGHYDPHIGKAIIDVIEQDGYSGDDDADIEQQRSQDEYEMHKNCEFITLSANTIAEIAKELEK